MLLAQQYADPTVGNDPVFTWLALIFVGLVIVSVILTRWAWTHYR